MIVLGFDTATPATAVGLRLADGTTLRARDDPAPGERPGHTARLLPLASGLLAQAGLGWGELSRIAVGVGPGTFTGLRVGAATARGLAQSLGIEVVGIGSLWVLAEAALRAPEAQPALGVLAMIDARRGEVFAAAYDATGELSPPRALAPQELAAIPVLEGVPPRSVLAPVSAAAGAQAPAQVASPAPAAAPTQTGTPTQTATRARARTRAWVAVGDGALRFREHLEAIAIAVPADTSPLHRVDAGVLCELAVDAPAGDPRAVLPDYRRRPDAEIVLERGLAAGAGKPGSLQGRNGR
jgi:tRNA threonylcarbamoyladenosine biosynthesis protein TsaB